MWNHFVLLLALASAINAASLGDVKHVIMLMMENRSFQHVRNYLPYQNYIF
jgi:phospholipase C